jgi:hypothetical protein
MASPTLPQFFPTFAAGYNRLLLLIRATRRIGVWLTPRVAMAAVLAMCGWLVWIIIMPGPTDRIVVPAAMSSSTQVGFLHSTPPPWPRGNCFDISSNPPWPAIMFGSQGAVWKVCNMNAENFSSIVRQLNLQEVEIQPLEGSC